MPNTVPKSIDAAHPFCFWINPKNCCKCVPVQKTPAKVTHMAGFVLSPKFSMKGVINCTATTIPNPVKIRIVKENLYQDKLKSTIIQQN